MDAHNIIVIGASAGGVEALKQIVRGLPKDLPATVFVVLHLSPGARSLLPRILAKAGPLPATHPEDPEEIKQGHIYVAPPNFHLMILDGHVGAVLGPKESRTRPAADALFRTAAQIYGPRVVGVVLTGALNDGTAGLQAIKEGGGIAIVQDPNEAYNPGMPSSALKYVKVDYCLPLTSIPPLLVALTKDPPKAEGETNATDANMDKRKAEMEAEKPTGFTCPECQASLWESQHGKLLEFRCRVGHTFLPESLLADQSEMVERALWSSLNVIEERAALIDRLAAQARKSDQACLASQLEAKRLEASRHSDQIRQMLLGDGDWYSVPAL